MLCHDRGGGRGSPVICDRGEPRPACTVTYLCYVCQRRGGVNGLSLCCPGCLSYTSGYTVHVWCNLKLGEGRGCDGWRRTRRAPHTFRRPYTTRCLIYVVAVSELKHLSHINTKGSLSPNTWVQFYLGGVLSVSGHLALKSSGSNRSQGSRALTTPTSAS